METTFQFQSRLLSSTRRNRRTKNPLALLNKIKGLVNRIFLQHNGEMIFIGKPKDFLLVCNHLFLTAGLLGIDLGFAVRKKYPGFCPYCEKASCQCGVVKPNSHKRWNDPIPPEGSVVNLQKMLAVIYPPERHTLEYQVKKLLEEVEESRKAILDSALIETQEELADVFARLASLASALKLPLS